MTRLRIPALLAALILSLLTPPAYAADKEDNSDFQARTFKSGDKTLLYRLIATPSESKEKRPLVVFLHGAGERGDDNAAQLKYLTKFLRTAAKEYNAVCIAPQCPKASSWANFRREANAAADAGPREPLALTLELIRELQKEFPIDENRIYFTGLSMGGFGTWDVLARHPEMVAAAVPICGGGKPDKAEKMTGVPIWVFHGDKDEAVRVERSREMVEALKKAGGNVQYTEYPGVGHNSWEKAYAEPELLKWMMSQKRKAK